MPVPARGQQGKVCPGEAFLQRSFALAGEGRGLGRFRQPWVLGPGKGRALSCHEHQNPLCPGKKRAAWRQPEGVSARRGEWWVEGEAQEIWFPDHLPDRKTPWFPVSPNSPKPAGDRKVRMKAGTMPGIRVTARGRPCKTRFRELWRGGRTRLAQAPVVPGGGKGMALSRGWKRGPGPKGLAGKAGSKVPGGAARWIFRAPQPRSRLPTALDRPKDDVCGKGFPRTR